MAIFKPFKAVRPSRDKVGLFATRTYLSYSKKVLKDKLENNPYTFLQIINPEFEKNKKMLKSVREKSYGFNSWGKRLQI